MHPRVMKSIHLRPTASVISTASVSLPSTEAAMTAAANSTLVSYSNPQCLFAVTDKLSVRKKIIYRLSSLPTCPTLTVKCANSSEQGEMGGLKDALSGMVDERVEELLNREENRVLLEGLEKASQRVEMAKQELAEIEKQEIEAKQMRDYVNKLESRAAEIAECQREIAEARAMVEEAQQSLSIDGVGSRDATMELESKEIDTDEERWESVKAASISAIVGSVAGLPISLAQVTTSSQLILPLSITFVSCALFGVTFRYATRRDLDNFQLKTGTAAAFGFVKGLGTLDGGPPLELEAGSFLSHAFNGAVYVCENLFVFAFAAVALDICYKLRIISPFPIRKTSFQD
ncbi:hypothetical protein NMG60_11030602 [Bertholletia excelsa]